LQNHFDNYLLLKDYFVGPLFRSFDVVDVDTLRAAWWKIIDRYATRKKLQIETMKGRDLFFVTGEPGGSMMRAAYLASVRSASERAIKTYATYVNGSLKFRSLSSLSSFIEK